MPFAMFKGEKTIEALAARLFPPQGKSTKTTANQTAALLNANPQLKDLSKVPAGSILLIPDTAPALAPGQQVAAPALAWQAAADHALLTLTSLAQRLDAIDKQASTAAQSLSALSTGKGLSQQETADFPDLSSRLPAGKKALSARLKKMEASGKARADLFASLEQQIGSLGKS
jgi:hypothetical protein